MSLSSAALADATISAWLDASVLGSSSVDLCRMLLACSISGGVLAMGVWLVRSLRDVGGRSRLPGWVACALWFVVLARLLVPWTPATPAALVDLSIASPSSDARSAFSSSQQVGRRPMLAPAMASLGGEEAAFVHAPESPRAAFLQQQPLPMTSGAESTSRLAGTDSTFWQALAAAALVAWAVGAAVMLVQMGRACRFARGVIRRSTPATDERALNLLEQCRTQMRVPRLVALRVARVGDLSGPSVAGVLQPVIVVPADTLTLDDDDLRAVLLHELAHVRRHDLLLGLMWSVALALHWFNPMAHMAVRCMRADREIACDQAALDALRDSKRLSYARTLVRMADRALACTRSVTPPLRPPAPAFAALLGWGGAEWALDNRHQEGFLSRVRRTGLGLLGRAAPSPSVDSAQRPQLLVGMGAGVDDEGAEIGGGGELLRRCRMITRYRSMSGRSGAVWTLGLACAAIVGVGAPLVSANDHLLAAAITTDDATAVASKAQGAPPKVNVVDSDTTAFELYFKPYTKDEGGRVAVPNVELIAMPQYHGVSEDGTQQTIDKRVTVVVQDRAKQFWPVIMRLSKAEAREFYAQINQAADKKLDASTFAKRFAKGDAKKEAEILADIIKSDQDRGPAVLNMRHGVVELKDGNMATLPPDARLQVRLPGELDHRATIWINGAPDGAGWYSVVYADQRTIEGLRTQLGRILGVAQASSNSDGVSRARLLTNGVKLNEWKCGDLAKNSTFQVLRVAEAKGPSSIRLSLIDGQSRKAAAEVDLSADGARALAAQIEKLLADRAAKGTKSATEGTMESCIAAMPYTIDAEGTVTLPAGIQMQALPRYHGVKEDGSRILDDRITIIANDEAQSFWPILARIDDDLARRLAADLKASAN